jgi:galactose mutarotase-like enzyme
MRSGLLTVLILAAVLLGLATAYRAHMRGNFHKLKVKANMESVRQDAPVLRPGGQEAIVLTRTKMMGDAAPEFLSATLLPGRGMNLLQITADIPGKGEVKLLASGSLEEAAHAMTGAGADANGQASVTMGDAVEVPWADALWGVPAGAGEHMTSLWRGHTLTLPPTGSGALGAEARGGLMLGEGADSESSETLPDGGTAEAVFHAGDFGGRWLSKTDVTVSAMINSRSMELTVVANNVGDVAEPIGIGWQPRFLIVSGDREQARLRIPGERRAEVRNRGKEQPTGTLVPVAGTPYDFLARDGVKLGKINLDDCFVAMRQNLLDNGPTAELIDPASGYGLRLTALSPTIKAMRVVAPAGANFVSIEPQYNYPDPLGKEWQKDADTGMVTLEPGQSTEWKVRLELFLLTGDAASR